MCLGLLLTLANIGDVGVAVSNFSCLSFSAWPRVVEQMIRASILCARSSCFNLRVVRSHVYFHLLLLVIGVFMERLNFHGFVREAYIRVRGL